MKNDFSALFHLGFSQALINCYAALYGGGPQLASQLAQETGIKPANLYRLLAKLESYGFADSLKTHLQPTYYTAVRVEDALDKFQYHQRQKVLPIIRMQRARLPPK